MATASKLNSTTPLRLSDMQARLAELEETLRAIREGEVDALVVSSPEGDRVYTLQGADQPYRVMIETISEGAATLSASGLILYANRRFADMLGLSIEKVMGSNLSDIVGGLESCDLENMLQRAQLIPVKKECDLLTAEGGRLAAHLSLSPLQCGDFEGICMVATDLAEQRRREEELAKANELLRAEIADRQRAESALRKAEDVFQAFLNHSPALVFVMDDEGRYVFCNEKVEEVVGIKPEHLLGKTSADWAPGESGRLLHEHDLAALSAGEATRTIELVPKPNGESAHLLIVRFPFVDSSGRELLGGVGVDITAQRRAEESLRHLSGRLLRLQDQERRRIASDLHDGTSQTLSALALNLAWLQNLTAISRNPQASEALAKTVGLAKQASDEVRNLSHLLHPPDLDTMGLVSAIHSHSRQVSQLTGIAVSVEVPDEVARLPQDIETALFRVFQESIENVRRHSGSRVATVRLSRERENIVLEIEDQGQGAAPSALTPGRAGGTSGIGVAGMRERVEQLNGNLEIESGNRGTRVRATIPVSLGVEP